MPQNRLSVALLIIILLDQFAEPATDHRCAEPLTFDRSSEVDEAAVVRSLSLEVREPPFDALHNS